MTLSLFLYRSEFLIYHFIIVIFLLHEEILTFLTGLLAMNSLSFVLKKFLFILHLWRAGLLLKNLCWWMFSFNATYIYITLLSSFLHGFWREVDFVSYPSFSIGKVIFFLWLLLRFSLSLFFCSLNLICLSINFLGIILLCVLWASWVCVWIYVINFGTFSAIIPSNISSVLSSPCISNKRILHLLKLSHSSWMFYSTFFIVLFSLHFSLGGACWHNFKISNSFLGYVESPEELIDHILHFCYSVLISSISFWSFLRDSISILTFLICSRMLFTVSIRVFIILIIIIVNSLSGYSNMCIISVCFCCLLCLFRCVYQVFF